MQKTDFSCKVVSVVLSATLVAGMDVPAIVYAADNEIVQTVSGELTSGNVHTDVSMALNATATTSSSIGFLPEVQNTTGSALMMPLSVEAPVVNDTFTDNGITYKVTRVATETSNGQVTLTDGKSASGDLVLANGVSYAGGSYDIKAFGDKAFAGNTALTGIDFSKTDVNELPFGCFQGCTSLASVTVNDIGTMNLLQNAVFDGCTSLTSLQMGRVVVSNKRFPFSGSSLKRLTVSELSTSSNGISFQNLPNGFTLTCLNSLSKTALSSTAFNNTPNATLIVPTAALQETYRSTFASASNVTVTTLQDGEKEAIALVTSANGTLLGSYATLSGAITAINEAESGAPYTITVKRMSGSEYVQWTKDIAPNKETVINFAGNSVNLPDTLTLQAPLTIKNVTNFDTKDGLCALNAGDCAFTMIKGGSFGFSEIKGNQLIFDSNVPGSKPLGTPCQFIGTGNNASMTIKNYGRADYYYFLPSMADFNTLFLNNAYLEVKESNTSLTDTTVTLQKGGLLADGTLTVDGLTGTGEIRFDTDDAALVIIDTAEGDFQLPNITAAKLDTDKISLPKNSKANFVNQNGDTVTIAESVVAVSNLGNFSSMKAALDAIEAGAEDAYTITLLDDVALPYSTTEGKFYRLDLPAKKITIDGNGHSLSGMGRYQALRNDLHVNGDVTFYDVNLKLGDTSIFCDKTVNVVVTESAKGSIDTLEDTEITDGSHSYVRPNVQMTNVNGNKKTVLTMTGYGSKEAPAPKYENYVSVYPYPTLDGKSMDKTILAHSWLFIPNDSTRFGDLEIPEAGGLATHVDTQTPTIQGLLVADGADASVQLTYNTTWDTLYPLIINGAITGSTAVSVTGGALTEGQTIVKAKTSSTENSFYLTGNDNFVLQKDGTEYKAAKPIATDITLDQGKLQLEVGKEVTLTATVKPDAADQTVTWSSSDESVATVDQAGKVTAVGAGTATITAKAGDKTAICEVTVTPEITAVTAITLDQSKLQLKVGKEATLMATVTPDNATDKRVSWSSSDETVATVDQAGKVTAVGAGTATITAKAGDKTAICEITVSKASSSGSGSSGGFSGSYNYPVRVEDTDNAAVTMDKSNATAGETVTITVKPEAGQQVDKVTVTDSAGNKITTTAKGDNRYSFIMPKGGVNVSVATVPAEAGSTATQIQMQIGSRQILVNNTKIQCDAAPRIRNNRTMVPVRTVVEAFGGMVDWDGENRVVTMNLAGQQLSLTIGQKISGIGVAPMIIDDRTYVPIRYIAEELGVSIEWDEKLQQVVITKRM